MSYGLSVLNDNNEIIISDSTINYHYAGQATYLSIVHDQQRIKGYSGTFSHLDGINYITYEILVNGGDPLVFIHPPEGSTAYYCVYKKYPDGFVGNLKRIKIVVMMTGAFYTTDYSMIPRIFCFLPPYYISDTGDNYGLQVSNSSNQLVFDSNKRPLSIIAGGEHVPPYDPTNGVGTPKITSGHPWRYSSNDHDFRSTLRKNSYQVGIGDKQYKNIMFATSTIAQACWIREQQGYKNSRGGWFSSDQQHWSWARWWVMYRNCCRLAESTTGTIKFESGWGPVLSGYAYEERYESGGWFGGGGGSSATGSAPYTQKTLNLRETMFLLADASKYE